jgi:type II secretion system protein G
VAYFLHQGFIGDFARLLVETAIMLSRTKSGFTLIEMLVVILIIALLAIIVIPRLLSATRKGREATLRADLHELRNAIQKFNSDLGDWPASLEQLVLPKTNPPSGNGGSGIALDSANYQGPYLRNPDQGLLKDPFTKASDWNYTPATGEVHSASTSSAINGAAYSAW